MVRLAYDISFAMFLGAEMPAITVLFATSGMSGFVERQFKRPLQEIALGWSALCEMALDRADEARTLMDRLW